ncbi:hypothetical protein RSAG8_11532, partial [Rhizoctonia solani AG-8 WAC10335]
MFGVTGLPLYPGIQQWEEAGVSLLNALENYLKLSTSLGKESLACGAPPTYLAARIDAALGSLHTTLGQQLAQSQSALAQTRNQMLVPLNSFPEEVLSDIFMHVVFAPVDQFDGNSPLSIRGYVIKIHCALHNLLGVCTMWRDVAINRGALWSIVPLFDKVKIPLDYGSTLDRALHLNKGVGLNLVANTRCDETDVSLLAHHVTQFRSVSIVNTPPHMIRTILGAFAEWHGPEPLRLSQLSLYRTEHGDQAEAYIFQDASKQQSFDRLQQSFDRLVKDLALLQMRGTLLNWETIAFSDRLTTFHLEDVILGFDTKFVALLGALSSATQLRELRIIRVSTYTDSTPLQGPAESSKFWLPTLESLRIEGLSFNTLRLLLLAIQSRHHRLSLTLTSKSRRIHSRTPLGNVNLKIDKLCELLKAVPVHVLGIVNGLATEPMLSAAELKKLVEVLRPLETLHIRTLKLESDFCMALERPREPHGSTFPNFVHLDFSCLILVDPDAVRRTVDSHSSSIQRRVSLAKAYNETDYQTDWEIECRRRQEQLINWLSENVPEFTMTDGYLEPVKFRQFFRERW